MKTNLILIIIFLSCSSFTFILNPYLLETQKTQDTAKEIELYGELPTIRTKSAASQLKTIKLTQFENYLSIQLLYNLGYVDIQIFDDMGDSVYNTSVNSQVNNRITIDISYLNKGKYAIRFINSQGQYMYGYFEI